MQKGRKKYLNPVLVFIIIMCAFLLWVVLASTYFRFGDMLFKAGKKVHDEMNRMDEDEEQSQRKEDDK